MASPSSPVKLICSGVVAAPARDLKVFFHPVGICILKAEFVSVALREISRWCIIAIHSLHAVYDGAEALAG
jgi:hypothetical protein